MIPESHSTPCHDLACIRNRFSSYIRLILSGELQSLLILEQKYKKLVLKREIENKFGLVQNRCIKKEENGF